MPLRLSIHRPDRMVVVVANGTVTAQDLAAIFREMVEAGVNHYRKIVEVAAATPGLTNEEMATFTELVREGHRKRATGPIAIVAHSKQDELAQIFAALTADDRPARIFRSIHEARKWLATMPVKLEE